MSISDDINQVKADIAAKFAAVKEFVSEVETELGTEAHALYLSVAHDASVAAGAAIQVAKDDFANLWLTVKAQLTSGAKGLLETFASQGWAAMVAQAKQLLININWKDVGATLAGIGATTLERFAVNFLGSLIIAV